MARDLHLIKTQRNFEVRRGLVASSWVQKHNKLSFHWLHLYRITYTSTHCIKFTVMKLQLLSPLTADYHTYH